MEFHPEPRRQVSYWHVQRGDRRLRRFGHGSAGSVASAALEIASILWRVHER